MKPFYFVKVLTIFWLLHSTLLAALSDKSAIVYYGSELSYPMVGIHDYIIVEPNNIEVYSTGFKKYKENMYAYVSINEMIKDGPHAKDIKKKWIIGNNDAWASYVMNIKDPSYQDYLLHRIKILKQKGYENFFFDTMDSYQLAPVSKEEKEQLRLGLIQFLNKFSKTFPDSKLIINRGFEVIDAVHTNIEAVLFESYYKGMNASTMTYKNISDEDRIWLDGQLDKIKAYNIPIIALDYQPLDDKEAIKENITNLQQKGFIPYVAEKTLTYLGYSAKNAIKREVLIIYNSHELENDLITFTNAHIFASMPLEYMGYIPILKDVNKPLPEIVSSQYAGVIIWLENSNTDMNRLMTWAKKCILADVKVLFLGDNSLSLQHPLAKELGLSTIQNTAIKGSKNQITFSSKIMNYETEASIKHHKFLIDAHKNHAPYLSYKNIQNQTSTIAAKTSWGGFVRDDALMSGFFGDYSMWIVDPFALFRDTLNLPYFPVPDPTTENGKRLAFVHLDGDGSMNIVENNTSLMSIELIERDFVAKYHIPQSMSIVESEVAPHGKYPQHSKRLEKAARKIFAHPHVEGATHTFTHPYNWQALEKDPTNEHYRTHWNIDYTYTTKRELSDSLDYINKNLMPKGKKAKTVFWSGDCFPSKNVIKYTYQHGIININGGDTTITNDKPWMQLVQSFGIKYGNYYQVYTGQQNENVYTNDWLGPFWAFKKVIQTFKLTESPRRLKPIDLYYHFYAASKRAAYIALTEVYDWVSTQDAMYIYTSDYPRKVTDFYDASLAKGGNSWLIKGFSDLRTLRVDKRLGLPDIQKSVGVLGYKQNSNDYYIHLDEKKKKILTLRGKNIDQNYLLSANARLISKKRNNYHFKGEMPISLDFHLKSGCSLYSSPKADKRTQNASTISLKFNYAKDVHVTTTCR